MASKGTCLFIVLQVLAVTVSCISAFPTPAAAEDEQSVYNRQLTEERPLQEQIAEADNVKAAVLSADPHAPGEAKEAEEAGAEAGAEAGDSDDFSLLKSLAQGQRSRETNETPEKQSQGRAHFIPDESDSTKTRRLAEEYDSTKTGVDDDDQESLRQVDGTPLTAEDIVQKIANKVYEEDDRGVFDRIVSKLLKLGLITDGQADSLELEVAEALQDLITRNAKNNEIQDYPVTRGNQEDYPVTRGNQEDYPVTRGNQGQRSANAGMDVSQSPSRRYEEDEEDEEDDVDEEGAIDDEVEREAGGNGGEAGGRAWEKEGEEREEGGEEGGAGLGAEPGNEGAEPGNELSPEDGLRDLQYFPNFYHLLQSLDRERDAQERETLITIMKTLIDFVKMMVKYGTLTPEEGVAYLENLDSMIALQTKNKLGKSLTPPDLSPPTGKSADDDDNTKKEAAKMQKQYENLKDSTKEEQPTESSHAGQSGVYLEAIRKNIAWLKKHNKEEGKADYDLSKLREFMDQQVDAYIDKGIMDKDEGETIKRIYGSL